MSDTKEETIEAARNSAYSAGLLEGLFRGKVEDKRVALSALPKMLWNILERSYRDNPVDTATELYALGMKDAATQLQATWPMKEEERFRRAEQSRDQHPPLLGDRQPCLRWGQKPSLEGNREL